MKTKFFMTMAVAMLVFAGCSNDENEMENWNGEIRLSSGLTAQQTRSIATDLQGDQIADGIHVGFFINEDAQSPTTTYPQNLDYTANGSGSFSGTAVYYPQSGNSVNIYAYAPWKDGFALNDTYAFSIRADQSQDADYLASDLLWGQPMKPTVGGSDYETANPVARTKNPVSVSFKHLLSKIQVTLIPDRNSGLTVEDFKGAKLEILSVLPDVSLALADGSISVATGTPAPVIAATYSKDTTPAALTAAAIVVPQTFTKGSKFMKVTLATGGELFYTLPDADGNLTLESGKVYTYDITVKLTGLTVTSKIENWSPIGNDPIPGTAVMD